MKINEEVKSMMLSFVIALAVTSLLLFLRR